MGRFRSIGMVDCSNRLIAAGWIGGWCRSAMQSSLYGQARPKTTKWTALRDPGRLSTSSRDKCSRLRTSRKQLGPIGLPPEYETPEIVAVGTCGAVHVSRTPGAIGSQGRIGAGVGHHERAGIGRSACEACNAGELILRSFADAELRKHHVEQILDAHPTGERAEAIASQDAASPRGISSGASDAVRNSPSSREASTIGARWPVRRGTVSRSPAASVAMSVIRLTRFRHAFTRLDRDRRIEFHIRGFSIHRVVWAFRRRPIDLRVDNERLLRC